MEGLGKNVFFFSAAKWISLRLGAMAPDGIESTFRCLGEKLPGLGQVHHIATEVGREEIG